LAIEPQELRKSETTILYLTRREFNRKHIHTLSSYYQPTELLGPIRSL